MQQRLQRVDEADHRSQRDFRGLLQELPRHRRRHELGCGRHDADADVPRQSLVDGTDLASRVLDVEAHSLRPARAAADNPPTPS
jgi:hypothetical protein